jgi:hypothetical protein
MVLGHKANLRDQLLANVFGAGFLIEFGGEMESALGGGFVEGTLEEEVEGLGDLAFELVPAEGEGVALFAHTCASIYAHFRA